MTGPGESNSGWGNSASARARSDDAWRSGPASVSANSLTPNRSRSPHQSQQSQSESSRDSGNNHDNHRKWQRPVNNAPPPDADFSDRGRNRDRRATVHYVDSHDRANRSRRATPEDAQDTNRRHYPKPHSHSPKRTSSRSHIPHQIPHVVTDRRDPQSQSIGLPFKPPHQRSQVSHRRTDSDGRKPPLMTASPQVPSKRDLTFIPPPGHPTPNKRHQRIPSSQMAAPHAKHSGPIHHRPIHPRASPFSNPPVTHRATPQPPSSHLSVTRLLPTATTGATPTLAPMPPPPPVAPRPPTLPPSPSSSTATVTSPLSAFLAPYRHAGSSQPASPAGAASPWASQLPSATPPYTRLEEVERLAFALSDPSNTSEVHKSLLEMLSAIREAPESSFLPPRQPIPPAAPAAAPTPNPLASIAPPPPPPTNALHPVGSPQPGSALASAVASFGTAPPPPPTLPLHATPVTAPLFDIRSPEQPRPAVTLHAMLLPSSLRVTPSRTHRACIEKFTSIPGSKDMQPIISSEPHAWSIHVKVAGVRQDDCAVFKVKFFGGDVV